MKRDGAFGRVRICFANMIFWHLLLCASCQFPHWHIPGRAKMGKGTRTRFLSLEISFFLPYHEEDIKTMFGSTDWEHENQDSSTFLVFWKVKAKIPFCFHSIFCRKFCNVDSWFSRWSDNSLHYIDTQAKVQTSHVSCAKGLPKLLPKQREPETLFAESVIRVTCLYAKTKVENGKHAKLTRLRRSFEFL